MPCHHPPFPPVVSGLTLVMWKKVHCSFAKHINFDTAEKPSHLHQKLSRNWLVFITQIYFCNYNFKVNGNTAINCSPMASTVFISQSNKVPT